MSHPSTQVSLALPMMGPACMWQEVEQQLERNNALAAYKTSNKSAPNDDCQFTLRLTHKECEKQNP
jgi:hypothetical protein